MVIKANKLSKVEYSMNRANNYLDDILEISLLPEAVKEKVKSLQLELKDFDLSEYQTSPTMLTGNVATQEEVLSIIKEESGYTKWTAIDPFAEYDDYEFNPSSFKSYYGVEYDEKEVKEYMFRRDTNNRDDIRSMTVTVFPSHFSVLYHTSRVSSGADGILTLKEFKKFIGSMFA